MNECDGITPSGVKVSFVASKDTLKPPGAIQRQGGQGSEGGGVGTFWYRRHPRPSPPPPASPPWSPRDNQRILRHWGLQRGVTPGRDRPVQMGTGSRSSPPPAPAYPTWGRLFRPSAKGGKGGADGYSGHFTVSETAVRTSQKSGHYTVLRNGSRSSRGLENTTKNCTANRARTRTPRPPRVHYSPPGSWTKTRSRTSLSSAHGPRCW
jgi:hypothetical protein